MFLLIFYTPTIPLIEVMRSNPSSIDPVSLRFMENQLPIAIQYLFEMLRRVMLPYCVLYKYLTLRRRASGLTVGFFLLLGITLALNAATLDRGPAMGVLFMLILGHLLNERAGLLAVFRPRRLVWFSVALILGGLISVGQYQAEFSLSDVVARSAYVLYYRMLYSPAEMASFAFETFNAQSGFLNGEFVRLFAILRGGQYVDSLQAAPFVAAPVTFVGDLWRQWGWHGVLIGTVVIGAVLQAIDLKAIRNAGNDVGHLTTTVILFVGSAWMIYGNAFGIITLSVLALGTVLGLIGNGRVVRR